MLPLETFNIRVSVCIKHYSQKNNSNGNCNDFSDYNDIIAPLDKLIMLHYFSSMLCTFPDVFLVKLKTIRRNEWHFKLKYECEMTDTFRQIEKDSYRLTQIETYMYCRDIYA